MDDRIIAAARPESPLAPLATSAVSRRRVLVTSAVVVTAVAVTAACGGGDESGGGDAAGSGGAAAGGTIPTSDIPVGGGEILTEQKVVITQPSAGEFKAFTAVCTHQGCLVGSVADGQIVCPCHRSSFSISDGSVTGGPAPSPLAAVPITVSGDTITLT